MRGWKRGDVDVACGLEVDGILVAEQPVEVVNAGDALGQMALSCTARMDEVKDRPLLPAVAVRDLGAHDRYAPEHEGQIVVGRPVGEEAGGGDNLSSAGVFDHGKV